MVHALELEELVEHFTLYPDETGLLRNKSGATRLGFSLSLKFLLWKARFPRGRGELPDNVIEFVAGQAGVPAADIGFYDWDGRQVKRHRAGQTWPPRGPICVTPLPPSVCLTSGWLASRFPLPPRRSPGC